MTLTRLIAVLLAVFAGRRTNVPASLPVLDCRGAQLVVFGNSIDLGLGLHDETSAWPHVLTNELNAGDEVFGLRVINAAIAGSAISERRPWPAEPLVDTVSRVLARFSPERLAATVVIIHPSLIELQRANPTDPMPHVESTVAAVVGLVGRIRALGVADVVVVPTLPTTAQATVGPELNAWVTAFNTLLREAEPMSVLDVSPITAGDGYGRPKFYDDFFFPPDSPFAGAGADGVHPDRDGHLALADALATAPDLHASLRRACAAHVPH